VSLSAAQKITACLWFECGALEAAQFYTSLFDGSSIDEIHHERSDKPSDREGEVPLVGFILAGQRHQEINGGPHDRFNDAISLSASREDQAEVDRLWAALDAAAEGP
jgi:predicted 3-demethylubiquinone-9 3-methyltransferase (glyoxalase superfamily)